MLRNARSLLLRSHVGSVALAYLIITTISLVIPMLDPLVQRIVYGILDEALRPQIPHQAPDPVSLPIMTFEFVRFLGLLITLWTFARWLYGPHPMRRILSKAGPGENQ